MAKNSTNEEGIDEVDRISDLPDSIIHQILSPFHMKHVVQTSVWSKRWRYVWKSHPFLLFDSDLLFSKEDDLYSKRRIYICQSDSEPDSESDFESDTSQSFDYDHYFSEQRRKCKSFLNFVDKVIHFRDNSSKILSFHLNHSRGVNDDDDHYNFKTWILFALRSNVEDLFLNVYRSNVEDFFGQLPYEHLFTCKSLTKLDLGNNNGNDIVMLNLPDSISLPRLKTLVLHRFRFEYSKTVANNIFSSRCFPVLESLVLLGCTFHKTSGIHISTPQLKLLIIINYTQSYYVNVDRGGDEYPIKLCAPNLKEFVCKDHLLLRDYSIIGNFSSLVKAEIGLGTDEFDRDEVPRFHGEKGKSCSQRMMKFLSAVHNVETLKLRAPFLKAVSGNNAVLESTSIQFCNLRCLKLETWLSVDCMNSITYLLNISPNIEFLSLDILREDRKGNSILIDSVLDEVHWEAGLSLHRLKDVQIHGALGSDKELKFLKILLKKAMVLESVTLYTAQTKGDSDIEITEEEQEEFVEALRTLPRAASGTKFVVA